ncbi:hypothetical protein GMD78_12315 [Ornithinibacillus sp. L9]|uniref:Uncharacterized protein n=1 Tax=Ornithinibacillus caprae TaxID=2678566 RepID=A0A6N8FMC7_9BACI|nr:hypothetical protein [Ornithinibacillus caprae]MUK89157.1 hypothetical protein [Ornithinibacillus caprae]
MKIALKIKKDNVVETIQHEIEELDLIQISETLKVINDIFILAQKDEGLQALLEEAFDTAQEQGVEAENMDDETSARLFKATLGAFETLLLRIPEQAFKLLSVLSGIELEKLMTQKVEVVFDIYDAILEVNDMDKLIKRAKKSLAVTKARINLSQFLGKKETKPA